MYDLFFKTMEELTPALRRGDIAECEIRAASILESLPTSPFHIATKMSISNDPASVAAHFDRFIKHESQRIGIAAMYSEMNGFDINPDRWYCDLFAYSRYGEHDDYDWLSNWQSEDCDGYEVNGLEELQAIYANSAFNDDCHLDARCISSLLVVIKFQAFMQSAAAMMRELRFPLLITAHDYDFIAEFNGTV